MSRRFRASCWSIARSSASRRSCACARLRSSSRWAFSAFALYADVGLTMILVAFWPLLGDPAREGRSVTEHLKLAALVNLARPGRMAGMTILLAAFLVASTVLFAALVTVSIAYATLVATRYVLPLADRIEGRADAGPKA